MASTPDKFVWIDGELTPWDQATVHISHLGWSTVAAVFDSINAYWNAQHRQLYALQLTEHLHRLLQSMKIMRLQTDLALEDLAEGALDLLRANGYRKDCRVRPVAYQPDADWFGDLDREPHLDLYDDCGTQVMVGPAGRPARRRQLLDSHLRQLFVPAGKGHLELPKQPIGAIGGESTRL